MAVAFSGQYEGLPSVVLGSGGVRLSVVSGSFNGTMDTFDVVSPVSNVLWAEMRGAPAVTTNGTTIDSFYLSNSINASGHYTLIASDTSSAIAVANPTVLRFTRAGTNAQDFQVLILSRG